MTCPQCGGPTLPVTSGDYCQQCNVIWPVTTTSSTTGSTGYYQPSFYGTSIAYTGPGLSQILKDNPKYEEEIKELKAEIAQLESLVAKLLEKPGMTEEILKEMLSEDDRRVLEVLKSAPCV